MCGRYDLFREEELELMRFIMDKVIERLGGDAHFPLFRPGEMAPTSFAPVMAPATVEAGLSGLPVPWVPRLMKWGFPQWKGSGVIINARRETLREKPTFRKLMSSGRVIVPANAFYEWKPPPAPFEGRKTKFRISPHSTSRIPLFMAGLAGTFRDPLGSPYDAYAIVTTAAKGRTAEIHDRMPLMLDLEAMAAWLDPSTPDLVIDTLPEMSDVEMRVAGGRR